MVKKIHTYIHACMHACIHAYIHIYQRKNFTFKNRRDLKLRTLCCAFKAIKRAGAVRILETGLVTTVSKSKEEQAEYELNKSKRKRVAKEF